MQNIATRKDQDQLASLVNSAFTDQFSTNFPKNLKKREHFQVHSMRSMLH